MAHSVKKTARAAITAAERRLRKTETPAAFERLPLNALRVFEAVATRGSFSAAAEVLHVTTAAVSMQIKSLEDYLQVQLLLRDGRRVALSAEGERLLPGVRRGLTELQDAMRALRADRAGGPLNISTIASFLQKWLLPRLPRFHALGVDTDLRIHTSRVPVEFRQSDFHAAIRMAAAPPAGLHAEKLLDEWFVPVCSAALLRQHGPLHPEGEHPGLPMLRSADEPWEFWLAAGRKRSWRESGSVIDDSLTILAAAELGQGYALTRWALAAGDIATGRLVRASEKIVRCPRAYYFVCPEAYLALAKVRRLRDWLHAEAAAFPQPDGPGG